MSNRIRKRSIYLEVNGFLLFIIPFNVDILNAETFFDNVMKNV